jgi:hypothetical protein
MSRVPRTRAALLSRVVIFLNQPSVLIYVDIRSEVFTVVIDKIAVFCVVTPCSLVGGYILLAF